MAFQMRRASVGVLLLAPALLVSSCQGIKPPAPTAEPEVLIPPVQPSSVTLAIRLSSAAIQAETDANLSAEPGPKGMYWTSGERISKNATIQFGVHRSGPTRVVADGDRLVFTIPVAIDNGRVDVESHGLLRGTNRYGFGGSGVVTLRVRFAVGPDWRLRASAEPGFQWTDRAWVDIPTPVGQYKVDVAKRVEPAIAQKLADLAARTEATAASRDTRAQVERAWMALQRPIVLSGQPPVALEIEPLSLSVGPLGGEGGDLVTRATLIAKLRARVGAPEPAPPPPRPLPDNSGKAGSDGVSLSLRIDVPFDELNARVRQQIVGKVYPLKGQRSLTVTGVSIMPLGRKIQMRVDFDAHVLPLPFGTLSGWVYFTGLPRYDDDKRQLRIENFGYDEGSRQALIKAGASRALDRFAQEVSPAMTFDLADKVDPARRRIMAGIHSAKAGEGNAVLDVSVGSFELSDLYVGRQSIGLFATARGHAMVSVSP